MNFERNVYYFFELGRPTFTAPTMQALFDIVGRITGKVLWVNEQGSKQGVGNFVYGKHPDNFMPYTRFEPFVFYLRPDYFLVIEDNHRLIATVPTLDAAWFVIKRQDNSLPYRIATLQTIEERSHEQAVVEINERAVREMAELLIAQRDYKGAIAL